MQNQGSKANKNDVMFLHASLLAEIELLSSSAEKHKEIFHYTSAKAFNDIVTKDGINLWASDIRCLNDVSELQEGKWIGYTKSDRKNKVMVE